MEDGGVEKRSDWNKSDHESFGDDEEVHRQPRRYGGGGQTGSHFNGGGSAQMNKNKFEDASHDSNRGSHLNDFDNPDFDSKYNRNYDKMSGDGKISTRRRSDQREVFPFRIFIKDEYLEEGISSRILIDEIIKTTGVDAITMDKNNQVPDFPGQIMVIEGDELSKREAALLQVLKHFEKIESFQSNNKNKEI